MNRFNIMIQFDGAYVSLKSDDEVELTNEIVDLMRDEAVLRRMFLSASYTIEHEKELKQTTVCKDCGHLSIDPIENPAQACCPDSRYIPIRDYLKKSLYDENLQDSKYYIEAGGVTLKPGTRFRMWIPDETEEEGGKWITAVAKMWRRYLCVYEDGFAYTDYSLNQPLPVEDFKDYKIEVIV